MRNELNWRSKTQIHAGLRRIWDVMLHSIYAGCQTEGELPGGLHVERRAAAISRRLLGDVADLTSWRAAIGRRSPAFPEVVALICCFALAVGKRTRLRPDVVTAPTNGAAGVIPAVLLYYLSFCDGRPQEVTAVSADRGRDWPHFQAARDDLGGVGRLSGRDRRVVRHGRGGAGRALGGVAGAIGRGRRDRDGAPPRTHLRPHRRTRADPLHRTQLHGRHQGDYGRHAGAAASRASRKSRSTLSSIRCGRRPEI